jgi:hypothetical protein
MLAVRRAIREVAAAMPIAAAAMRAEVPARAAVESTTPAEGAVARVGPRARQVQAERRMVRAVVRPIPEPMQGSPTPALTTMTPRSMSFPEMALTHRPVATAAI